MSSGSLTQPLPKRSLRQWLKVLLVVPVLSVAGHVLIVGAVIGASQWAASAKPKKVTPRPMTLRKIDARRWAANRGKTAQATPMQLPEKPDELHPKGQVVDVAPGNEALSSDAKYLAETNNRVKKQTVAREQTNTYSRAAPKNAPDPMLNPMARGRSAPTLLGASATELFTSQLGTRPQLTDLFQRPSLGDEAQADPHSGAVGSTSSDEPATAPGDSAEGGGAPPDDLRDVESGDGTYLNTREWRFASFFNRVKQAVVAHWDPEASLRAKGKQMSPVDRVTVMAIALTPDGAIADLYVAKSSGVDELDVAAMTAFQKAAPFANPPQALVEKGFIRFTFSFLVTNDGMPRFGTPQFFRSGR